MHTFITRSYKFWDYTPSIAAAVIFMLIFIALTCLHFWRIVKAKTAFCIPFVVGGLFEVIGYIGRCFAHSNTTAMGPYIISYLFVLLGPTLFAASIYMTLGRLMRRVNGEHLSPIRVSYLTKTFVGGDILSFVVQASSSSLSVMGYAKWAKLLVILGLVIQLVSFSLFWLTAIVFAQRIRQSPTDASALFSWEKFLHMLYFVSGLIIVRSIFRIVEYALGNDGYPLMHEWTIYIFDSVPMAAVMVVFFIWYPSRLKTEANQECKIPLTQSYASV